MYVIIREDKSSRKEYYCGGKWDAFQHGSIQQHIKPVIYKNKEDADQMLENLINNTTQVRPDSGYVKELVGISK